MKSQEILIGLLILLSSNLIKIEAQQQNAFRDCVNGASSGFVYDFNFGNKVEITTIYDVIKNIQKLNPIGINSYCFGIGLSNVTNTRNNYKVIIESGNKKLGCDINNYKFYSGCNGTNCEFGNTIGNKIICSGELYDEIKTTSITSSITQTSTTNKSKNLKPTATIDNKNPEETKNVKSSSFSLKSEKNKIIKTFIAFSLVILSSII